MFRRALALNLDMADQITQPVPVESSQTVEQRPKASTVRIGVRLLDAIDGPLRELCRHQGDFAANIVDAVMTVDLAAVPLVVIRDKKVKDTTVRVEEDVFRRLSAISESRRTSVNILVNTAVAHWLESKRRRNVVRYR
jgi:hypothetical protein